jgi:hypothetical protein
MFTSVCSTLKLQKVQFDDSQSYPAQKPEAPLWLVLHCYLAESTDVFFI